jgi:tellurite resistance protein TerC
MRELLWIIFIGAVLLLVALDLFVVHRKDEVISVRKALRWSAFWIGLALAFNACIYFLYRDPSWGLSGRPSTLHPKGLNGEDAALLFFMGYVIELSLSVDNLFVMALIFKYFKIPPKYQHRVLFWGILGVLGMRGVMIGLGAALIAKFSWILYVFGAILLFTAYKMMFGGGEPDPSKSLILRVARRFFPITHELHGHALVIRKRDVHLTEEVEEPEPDVAKKPRGFALVLTPLALALVVVETTDVIFAVDSIPAIFAITTDPFLVFTSNVAAVLGLRSLYFALSGVLEKFRYLKYSLAAILALIGVKMLLSDVIHDIPGMNFYMLGVVALFLGAGVVASLRAAPLPAPTSEIPQEENTKAQRHEVARRE